jgi:hypothetical protein
LLHRRRRRGLIRPLRDLERLAAERCSISPPPSGVGRPVASLGLAWASTAAVALRE